LFMKNLKMKWFWRFSRANRSFYNFWLQRKKILKRCWPSAWRSHEINRGAICIISLILTWTRFDNNGGSISAKSPQSPGMLCQIA
jgi:hypothetical protein